MNIDPFRNVDVDVNFFELEDSDHYLRSDAQYQLYNSVTLDDILSNGFNADNSSLSVLHLNIRSMHKNLDALLVHLGTISIEFDVICFSETWMRDDAVDPFLPDYCAYHSVRKGRRGGGVAIYVHKRLSSLPLPNMTANTCNTEAVFARIRNVNKNIIIYRSHI